MSYCRGKYYIYPDGVTNAVHFYSKTDNAIIPNDMMDVFLYSLSRIKKEMRGRIKHGKKLYKGMAQAKEGE